MKKLKLLCCIGMLVGGFDLSGQAADKSPSASMRAYLYQREARAVLTQRNWHIVRDRAGRLTASQPTHPNAMSYSAYMVLLTIVIKPDNASHTNCLASVVVYTYVRAGGQVSPSMGPLPYNTPEMTQEIQDMMIRCEKQLIAAHPEYARR